MPKPPDERRCTSPKSDKSGRCEKWAIRGGTVCNTHGGSAPQVKRKAASRVIQERANRMGLLEGRIADDPIGDLMELGGQTMELVDAMRRHVAELESVGTEPGQRYGETVQPAISAYLDSIAKAQKCLESLVRLGLAERFIKLDEARVELCVRVIERVLARSGLNPEEPQVREFVARELTVVAGTG